MFRKALFAAAAALMTLSTFSGTVAVMKSGTAAESQVA